MPDKTKVYQFITIGGLAGTIAGTLVEQAVLERISFVVGLVGAILFTSRK